MTESDFGITEFVADHKGFFGIIKQRFSDFIVNEISSSGEIVHLTSEEVLPIPEIAVINKVTEKPVEISDDENEILKVLSGQKQPLDVPTVCHVESESGVDYKFRQPKRAEDVMINVEEVSKEKRTLIHQYIKANFPNLNSTTKSMGNKKVIYVSKKDKTLRQDNRNIWPKSQNHVHFVLFKENIDTIDAINVLSAKLRLKPALFCYAGTKDRRAKTSQMVSAFQIVPKNISSASNSTGKIRVGNFSFTNKGLKLGQAKGNFFKLVLRELKGSDEVIDEAFKCLREKGFINYFGMQRFSTSNISTHKIGKALLLGHWDEVCRLILSTRENDSREIAEAKRIWTNDKDAHLAFESLRWSQRNSVEGQLLSGLADSNSRNKVNAIGKISRNIKLMYLHAYQSYIWNNVVSARIKKYGLKVLPGDLVRIKNSDKNSKGRCDELDPASDSIDLEEEDGDVSKCVRTLTEEESQTADITEVVMPLPGYAIMYPDNELKDWYLENLVKDNLSFEMFRNKVSAFSLKGAYRPIILRPHDVEYSCCYYNDPTLPLVESDVDILKGENFKNNRLAEGANKALILKFSLSSCAYATMLLRELLRMETSSKFHSSLNTTGNIHAKETKSEAEVELGNHESSLEKRKLEESDEKRPYKKIAAV